MLFNPLEEMHFDEAIVSLKSCINAPFKLLSCILLDILFFVVYGLLSAPIFAKLTDYTILVGAFVSQTLKSGGRNYINNKSVFDILTSEQVLPFFTKFLLLLLLLGAIIYFLYCIFQGIIWKLASSLAGYDLEWAEYIKAFARTNILWFGIFVVYYFGSLFFQIRTTVLTKINPSYAPNFFWEVLFGTAIIIVLYFMILSYISGGLKIGFKAGVKGWPHFAPPIFLIMFVFLVINQIMIYAGLWILELAYLFGLVFFLPALTWAKVYICRIAAKLGKNGVLPQY